MLKELKKATVEFMDDESGQSTVEYVVIIALVVIVAIGALALLGKKISGTFGKVNDTLAD